MILIHKAHDKISVALCLLAILMLLNPLNLFTTYLIPENRAEGNSTKPVGAVGTYNPATDEINIYLEEDTPRYQAVLTHEKAHRTFFQKYGSIATPILQYTEMLSYLLVYIGFLGIKSKPWIIGWFAYTIPRFIVETHANLTELSVHAFSHPLFYTTIHPILYSMMFITVTWFAYSTGTIWMPKETERIREN